VALGGLIVLGLMHGIVPTIDALAILLIALNVQQTGLGIGLVFAYSLGIASVLIAVGALFVRTQRVLLDSPRFERVSRLAPALAASMVILLGLSLVVRTLIA
jgi:ABC-type nickel/cobalt efflux system permease component RcnA